MREYTDLEKIRLAKMERLRAAGMEPYPPRAGRTHTTAEALTDYQRQAPADAHTPHGNYTLAGRLRSVRVMGKAAFAHVEDGDGKLQLYFRADEDAEYVHRHVFDLGKMVPYVAKPFSPDNVFPVDEGAAVCGFEARIGETRVVGRVRDREEAFAEYDDALLGGDGAYLLDEERPDVFTASVGNIPPGESVELRVATLAPLDYEGERVRFVLPTTVSPRYAPAEDRRGLQQLLGTFGEDVDPSHEQSLDRVRHRLG